jgi:23S rRNA (cytidine1920-2'-O)/16S rRNA (cytidine1409-2'-O)-methyltransferase
MKGQRADLALVAAGFFASRAKAIEAIEAGLVSADGQRVAKPSSPIRPGAVLAARAAHPWVSRGGVKLAHALDVFPIDPRDKRCLDIGASTGGFTHVLLTRGAARVVAVDVGQGQMHATLGADPRVSLYEGMDARRIDLGADAAPFDLVVIDVSFISLRLVLAAITAQMGARADLVALIKPQFEVGPRAVKKGIVRDAALHDAVCADISQALAGLGWTILGLVASPIEGGDGNREFLIGARRGTPA